MKEKNEIIITVDLVVAWFSIKGKNVDPMEITKQTNIIADQYHIKGEELGIFEGFGGGSFDPYIGEWSIETRKKINSTDVNQHLSYLLSILLPHKDIILTSSVGADIEFGINFVYSGNLVSNGSIFSNFITSNNLLGIAQLNASISFTYFTVYKNLPD